MTVRALSHVVFLQLTQPVLQQLGVEKNSQVEDNSNEAHFSHGIPAQFLDLKNRSKDTYMSSMTTLKYVAYEGLEVRK